MFRFEPSRITLVGIVVLEGDESIRRMKLLLDLYVADEQAAFLAAWVLLEANIEPRRPFCGPDFTRHEQVGKAIIPQCSPYRRCALMLSLIHI